MAKKHSLPQSRRHIFINDEDWEFLESRFGKSSPTPKGVGWIIRELIHAKVKQIREREVAERMKRQEEEKDRLG